MLDCSDRKTIDMLYQKLGRAAYAKAFAVVRRQDVAQEVVQDVFVKLWQKGGVFPNEKAVYVWVYKACTNAGIDYLRSATVRREVNTEDMAHYEVSNMVKVEDQNIDRDMIDRFAKKLKARDLEVFMYVVVDEMSHAQASEILGVSEKTIQRTMNKLRDKFKSLIGDDHG